MWVKISPGLHQAETGFCSKCGGAQYVKKIDGHEYWLCPRLNRLNKPRNLLRQDLDFLRNQILDNREKQNHGRFIMPGHTTKEKKKKKKK